MTIKLPIQSSKLILVFFVHVLFFLTYLIFVSREKMNLVLVVVGFIPEVIVVSLVILFLINYLKSKKAFILFATIPLTVILAIFAGSRWLAFRDYNYELTVGLENQNRAGLILNALYQYKNETGLYPNSLDQLVPNRLNSLPITVEQKSFMYSKNNEGFQLDYPDRFTGKCYKETRVKGKWEQCNFPI